MPNSTKTQLADLRKRPVAAIAAGGTPEHLSLAGCRARSSPCRRCPSAAGPDRMRPAYPALPRDAPLLETTDAPGAIPRRCRATQRLDRWGASSPTRSRRACLKTCRMGRSVKMPIAKTTHNMTSCVNVQARWLTAICHPKALAEPTVGAIIFSNPASLSKTRPDSSGGSTQRPCRVMVTASLLGLVIPTLT